MAAPSFTETRTKPQPSGQIPGAVAEQRHARRQQDPAYQRRVDENGRGRPDTEHLELDDRQGSEYGEYRHHDHRCAGDDAGALADSSDNRVPCCPAVSALLADAAEDEHVVEDWIVEQEGGAPKVTVTVMWRADAPHDSHCQIGGRLRAPPRPQGCSRSTPSSLLIHSASVYA